MRCELNALMNQLSFDLDDTILSQMECGFRWAILGLSESIMPTDSLVLHLFTYQTKDQNPL